MPNYVTASGSNSILYQLSYLRAQGIYQSGGVSDSAVEPISSLETTPSIQVQHMMMGGATSQLDLPSLTPFFVAGLWPNATIGIPHWTTSVDYCKLLIITNILW